MGGAYKRNAYKKLRAYYREIYWKEEAERKRKQKSLILSAVLVGFATSMAFTALFWALRGG